MKQTLNILLIILALMTEGCEKTYPPLPTKLPPITQEGKNTFGCLIEGEVYVPDIRKIVFMPPYEIDIKFPQYPDYYFSVTTQRVVNDTDTLMNAEVGFGSNNIWTTGTYTLDGSIKYNNKYYRALPGTTSLTITRLDTIKEIISGQFYFQASKLSDNFTLIDINDPDWEIITISNGRFDLKRQ